MDGASNQLFARARLPSHQHSGISRRHFGDACKHSLECRRFADDLFKHRGLDNFFTQRNVFFKELVLERLNFSKGSLQGCSRLMLLGHVHHGPDVFRELPG